MEANMIQENKLRNFSRDLNKSLSKIKADNEKSIFSIVIGFNANTGIYYCSALDNKIVVENGKDCYREQTKINYKSSEGQTSLANFLRELDMGYGEMLDSETAKKEGKVLIGGTYDSYAEIENFNYLGKLLKGGVCNLTIDIESDKNNNIKLTSALTPQKGTSMQFSKTTEITDESRRKNPLLDTAELQNMERLEFCSETLLGNMAELAEGVKYFNEAMASLAKPQERAL